MTRVTSLTEVPAFVQAFSYLLAGGCFLAFWGLVTLFFDWFDTLAWRLIVFLGDWVSGENSVF